MLRGSFVFRICFGWLLCLCLCFGGVSPVLATLVEDDAIYGYLHRLADPDADARKEVLSALASTGDSRVEAFFEAYRIGSVYLLDGKIVLCEETIEDDDLNEFAPLVDPLTRQPLQKGAEPLIVPLEELTPVSPTRSERRLITSATYLLRLYSPDTEMRLSGAKKCGDPPGVPEARDRLEELAMADPVQKVKHVAKESLLLLKLEETHAAQRWDEHREISRSLGEMRSMRALPRFQDLLSRLDEAEKEGQEIDATTRLVYKVSSVAIERHQGFVDRIGGIFQGISLGSVLIIMALGLAITFGLMGVINMAHGEFLMIGAYATYEMQLLFMRLIDKGHLPESAYGWYYVAAFPTAFLSAAFFGIIVEYLVVRHLYRMPLESLLATWGVGLVMIQMVRLRYGDNIGVNAPEWARGGVEVMQDVILPNSRCFIIALCAFCVILIYSLMRYTTLGLQMRATMQNRDIAKSLGVNTDRVDRYTFAFGTGIAGIAGYAWTLIGGVTPDMGQKNFIVDSFLVVVVGGVGEIVGVICSGLGIGVVTKFLEPIYIGDFVIGAIWAKVLLLVVVVIFIQFKPAGLFAPKGRLADV